MSLKPINQNPDPMYRLLREGRVKDFNERKELGEKIDLTWCDFRGMDLRGLNTQGLDLSSCYFRQTDLRGLDLSSCQLEGASINAAKISGTLFPKELTADEITLSLLHGTRMRYRD